MISPEPSLLKIRNVSFKIEITRKNSTEDAYGHLPTRPGGTCPFFFTPGGHSLLFP
jgi:hypothetical protein